MSLEKGKRYVPGPFQPQLQDWVDENHFPAGWLPALNRLKPFIFPTTRRLLSVQAGWTYRCTYSGEDGTPYQYPFFDGDVRLFNRPASEFPYDRVVDYEVSLLLISNSSKLPTVSDSAGPAYNLYLVVRKVYLSPNMTGFCKPVTPARLGIHINGEDAEHWSEGDVGNQISVDSIQLILDGLHEQERVACATMIQKHFRGWQARKSIAWNPNCKVGYGLEQMKFHKLSMA